MYATERREGEKGVEGKASSRAKCWWEGADQLGEVALLLGSPSDFILHAERHFPGSPHTLPTTPKPWRGSPGDQGARKPNYFSAGHWRTLNYTAQPKSWAEIPKQKDALS